MLMFISVPFLWVAVCSEIPVLRVLMLLAERWIPMAAVGIEAWVLARK